MRHLVSVTKYWRQRNDEKGISDTEIKKVEDFFAGFPDFRTYERCAEELNLSVEIVELIYKKLCKERRLGPYSLGIQGNPQKYMLAYLCDKLPIVRESLILEVGPGCNPVFNKQEFPLLFSVDRYFTGQYGNAFGQRSVADAIATYSNLAECQELSEFINKYGAFDLVFGSHSFEHEVRPVKAIRSIRSVLKVGGAVALFVPDGFSNEEGLRDPSHTMNITPDMAYDLFEAAGGFVDIEVTPWRPNWDQILIAKRG